MENVGFQFPSVQRSEAHGAQQYRQLFRLRLVRGELDKLDAADRDAFRQNRYVDRNVRLGARHLVHEVDKGPGSMAARMVAASVTIWTDSVAIRSEIKLRQPVLRGMREARHRSFA